MKAITTFTFCCDNLWKSKLLAPEKPGKLGIFLLLFGHPDADNSCSLCTRFSLVLTYSFHPLSSE